MGRAHLKDIDERLGLMLNCSWCKQAVQWIDLNQNVMKMGAL
jgi:hypothetical protein